MDLSRALLTISGFVYAVVGSLEHFKALPDFGNNSCLTGSLFTINVASDLQCTSFCIDHGSDCKGVSHQSSTGQCHGCGVDNFLNLDPDTNSSIYKRASSCIDETSPDDSNTIAASSLISNSLICPTVIATVDNGYIGTWFSPEFCPVGTYAIGFNLKVESPQGGYVDDTAVNSVELTCASPDHSVNGGNVISQDGWFGDWMTYIYCDVGHVLKAHQLRVETGHEVDSAGVSNMQFKCGEFSNNADMEILNMDSGNPWGELGSWSEPCGPGEGICGLRVRIHEDPGDGSDITALNDVVTYCYYNEPL